MGDDVLHDVVAELIAGQRLRVGLHLGKNRRLRVVVVLKDALNHTAAVGMRGQLLDDASETVDDKGAALRVHFDALLNDMVAVLVLDAPGDIAFQLAVDDLFVLSGPNFDAALDHAAAVGLQRQGDDATSNVIHNEVTNIWEWDLD